MRDVVERVRFQNHKIGEISFVDLTNVRTSLAAEEFGGIGGSALEDLRRRETGFLH